VAAARAGRRGARAGKTWRHSGDTAAGQGALHLVRAGATVSPLLVGQRAVETQSNAPTALPELLPLRDRSGAGVTRAALGGPKDSAAQGGADGGDYVWARKENQPPLDHDGAA
jgi:hypothetical protein